MLWAKFRSFWIGRPSRTPPVRQCGGPHAEAKPIWKWNSRRRQRGGGLCNVGPFEVLIAGPRALGLIANVILRLMRRTNSSLKYFRCCRKNYVLALSVNSAFRWFKRHKQSFF